MVFGSAMKLKIDSVLFLLQFSTVFLYLKFIELSLFDESVSFHYESESVRPVIFLNNMGLA